MARRRSKDVTERDAFGNPIEDARPIAQPLIGGDPLRVAPAPAPAPVPVAATAPSPSGLPASELPAAGSPLTLNAPAFPPAPLPPRPRRRRGLGRLLGGIGGLLGLLLFFGPFLVGGWFVYRAVHDTVDDTTSVIRSFGSSVTTTGTSGSSGASPSSTPAKPPRGLGARSLLAPKAVNTVLRSARLSPGGKLILLRLTPERADLQLARAGGGLNILQLRFDGGRSLVKTPAGGTGSKTIIFSKIDRQAPARLVRAAAHRLGRKASSIDYLVLINILGSPQWSAYFKGGAAFQGDAHGKIVRRIQ